MEDFSEYSEDGSFYGEDDVPGNYNSESEFEYSDEDKLEGGAYQLAYIDEMGMGYGGELYGGFGTTAWNEFRMANKGKPLSEVSRLYKESMGDVRKAPKSRKSRKSKGKINSGLASYLDYKRKGLNKGFSLDVINAAWRTENPQKKSYKKKTVDQLKKRCKDLGKYYNPETRRCNKRAKLVGSIEDRFDLCFSKDKLYNQKTNRCNNVKRVPLKNLTSSSQKEMRCKLLGKFYNPKTGRCSVKNLDNLVEIKEVKRRGKKKKIIEV